MKQSVFVVNAATFGQTGGAVTLVRGNTTSNVVMLAGGNEVISSADASYNAGEEAELRQRAKKLWPNSESYQDQWVQNILYLRHGADGRRKFSIWHLDGHVVKAEVLDAVRKRFNLVGHAGMQQLLN